MRTKTKVLASLTSGIAAASLLTLTACSASTPASAPCTTSAQFTGMLAELQTAQQNAVNGTPIPAHTTWPETAQLAANPQYSLATANSLYWAYEWVVILPARMQAAPPMCSAS
jgi:hypothetical protein